MTEAKQIEEWIGVGRRKRAVASVRVRPGTGKIDVNGRTLENYFPQKMQQQVALSPIAKIDGSSNHDIIVRVRGGGPEGQAEALRLGIARALVQKDETLHHDFKDLGFLTRDSRKRERKKYGQPGARKRFQFSKR